MKHLLYILLLITVPYLVNSQIVEGVITYDITVVEISNEKELTAGQKPTLEYTFRDNLSKIVSDHPTQGFTVYSNEEENIILLESMGQKNAYIANSIEYDQFFGKDMNADIRVDKTKERVILGYPCSYYSVNFEDGSVMNIYYTTEIIPHTKSFPFNIKESRGFPLYIEITKNNIITTYTASEINEIPEEGGEFFRFSIPEDYIIGDISLMMKMKNAFDNQN
ncbi:MAG: hypothetical protein HKN22_05995 [Bacteroidia bacterium]|nr:hypothetical protein [Bacteroidia bacterium]